MTTKKFYQFLNKKLLFYLRDTGNFYSIKIFKIILFLINQFNIIWIRYNLCVKRKY